MLSLQQALRILTLLLLPLAAISGPAFAAGGYAGASGGSAPVSTQSSSSPTFSNPINQGVPPATSTLNRYGVPPYRLPATRRR